jgi:myosin heavy subunit
LAEHAQTSAKREQALEHQLNAVKQKLTHADSAFSAKVHAEHAARKQLNQLRDELRDRSQRTEDWEEANQNLQQELDALKNSNIDLGDENAKLNARSQSLEAESQNVKAELKALKQLIEAAQQETAQLREAAKSNDKKAETLHERLKQIEQKSQQLAEDIKKEQSAHQETKKSLVDHTQWFQSRKQQAEELQAQNDTLKQQLEIVSQEKQQVLEAQGNGQQALGDLEAKMEKLFSQQADQLRQATNAVGQHVTQSFNTQRQQFQAVASLSTYLETGEQPVDFGGWAIGADLAGHLVRAIEQNQYDLIIEFGSGSSTVLMAKAIQNTLAGSAESLRNSALQYDGANQGQPSVSAKALEASSQYDLPERILSFEQNQDYAAQTQAALASSGLGNLVDLVLAPLVPIRVPIKVSTSGTSPQGAQPLFYDCEQKLAAIAQLFSGRAANILVLIDGPHSPSGEPLIREPALATVLQYLSAHQLHIVLDDAHRQGEKQVAQDWLQLCTQRGLRYRQTELNTEKGALWLTINPQG